jgi:hypothetical protein
VAKWTRRVDIFSKDFLFVPICESLHWTLAIVCYPSAVASLDAPDAAGGPVDARGRRHTILYLDSMGGFLRPALRRLTDYLRLELRARATAPAPALVTGGGMEAGPGAQEAEAAAAVGGVKRSYSGCALDTPRQVLLRVPRTVASIPPFP